MVKLSRFAHLYDLGRDVALYHSLRMRPVYLDRSSHLALTEWLSSEPESVDSCPDEIKKCVEELVKNRILAKTSDEDDRVLAFVRSRIPKPDVNVCYFILTEQCNLACKYCFLGNNDSAKRSHFLSEHMTVSIADKALDFFLRQLKNSDGNFEFDHPVIIFYGGEPLLNFPVLEHVAKRVNDLRETESCMANAELSIVTNGTLLDGETARKLQALKVQIGISIDGFSEKSNALRVDVSGKPAYPRIIRALEVCRSLGINVSLSVTLNEETIQHSDDVLRLISDYNIRSLGFNIMMSSESFPLPAHYSEKAAQFIIDQFVELRKLGIYEDRMMRKLKSFTKAKVYYSDCAATAGSQLVFAPNGRIGICHGCLHDKKFFITDVKDKDFLARNNPLFSEWANLTPVNREECQNCPALGICGGGCPINAMNAKPGNTIHSMDERFCVHAKKTLDFFIRDLHRIMSHQK